MKTLIPVFLLIVLIFLSCKKDLSHHEKINSGTSLEQKDNPEIGFPSVVGDWDSLIFNGKTIYVEKKNGKYIWMGDIAFDQKTIDSLRQNNSGARTFKNIDAHLWTGGKVYFEIDPSFIGGEIIMINAAIQHWRDNSSLEFISRTNQNNYVRIERGEDSSGLYSDYVGMKGGKQIINLEPNIFVTGNIIHEIGHTIGFYHEQSRTDRGNAIVVNFNNIIPHSPQNVNQFQTYATLGESGSQIGNFDFNSIMLYSSWALSDFIHPTMTRLDGSTFWAQRVSLSAGDIETAAYIYGPPFAKITKVVTSSYYDPYDADFDEYGDIVLNFYSDKACSIPTTLTDNKAFHYKKYISERNNGVNYNYSIAEGFNLTAGSSSYTIDRYHEFDDSYRGYSNNYYYLDLSGTSPYTR